MLSGGVGKERLRGRVERIRCGAGKGGSEMEWNQGSWKRKNEGGLVND